MINGYLGGQSWPDAKPRRISDVIGRSSFHRTRTYNELFRLVGMEHQLVVMTLLGRPFNGRGWAFGRSARDPDFGDADLALASSVQPVLAAADQGALSRTAELPSDAAASTGLTPREIEVLTVISHGLTAQACGHALRISERTVSKHLQNAYAKLNCQDRLSAVLKARQLGLI
jgi:DNA-binding CsgD family transcriptional regulator